MTDDQITDTSVNSINEKVEEIIKKKTEKFESEFLNILYYFLERELSVMLQKAYSTFLERVSTQDMGEEIPFLKAEEVETISKAITEALQEVFEHFPNA